MTAMRIPGLKSVLLTILFLIGTGGAYVAGRWQAGVLATGMVHSLDGLERCMAQEMRLRLMAEELIAETVYFADKVPVAACRRDVLKVPDLVIGQVKRTLGNADVLAGSAPPEEVLKVLINRVKRRRAERGQNGEIPGVPEISDEKMVNSPMKDE